LERGFVSLFNVINDTAKLQRESAEQIMALREAQKETDERLKDTDERPNGFILVVERSISERVKGNGASAVGKKTVTKKRQSRK
jgi:hypothetical protein